MRMEWTYAALVGIGAFLGAVARYALSEWIAGRFPSRFPYGTLTVNVLGSFGIGWIVGVQWDEPWRLLAGVGFLGAFTTFSTLKAESVRLMRDGRIRLASAYLGISYVSGVCAAFAGLALGAA